MCKKYLRRLESSFSKKLGQTPKWILFSGLAGMAISLVAVIVILDYLKDATDIVNNYGLNNTELIIAILSKKLIGMFCLGVFVLSAAAVLGYFIVPLCHALLDTLFDALFSKDSLMNTIQSKETIPSEEAIQSRALPKPQNAKELDNKLTIEQRIERIKPLIVYCFWGSSLWEGKEDNTRKFLNSLSQILGEEYNIMKLGHLAYILRDRNWTAEVWPNFKDWIIKFFEVLCMQPPRDTSPNKYSYSENNPSPYSTTFSKIDKEFEYLLDEKYQATLKNQSRPRHESTS